MKHKQPEKAYRHEYRRQYINEDEVLPPPAETHQEGGHLVMTIRGVRYIGKRDARGLSWVPENGER